MKEKIIYYVAFVAIVSSLIVSGCVSAPPKATVPTATPMQTTPMQTPGSTAVESVSLTVQLPPVAAWYNGSMGFYLQTEASDQQVVEQQGVNFVPLLARAIDAKAVDDIYVVTNFKQANVIPSAPIPTGPGNKDPNYSPLWHVSTVTWNQSATPHTLHSEEGGSGG
jgi:hypothetical protein